MGGVTCPATINGWGDLTPLLVREILPLRPGTLVGLLPGLGGRGSPRWCCGLARPLRTDLDASQGGDSAHPLSPVRALDCIVYKRQLERRITHLQPHPRMDHKDLALNVSRWPEEILAAKFSVSSSEFGTARTAKIYELHWSSQSPAFLTPWLGMRPFERRAHKRHQFSSRTNTPVKAEHPAPPSSIPRQFGFGARSLGRLPLPPQSGCQSGKAPAPDHIQCRVVRERRVLSPIVCPPPNASTAAEGDNTSDIFRSLVHAAMNHRHLRFGCD